MTIKTFYLHLGGGSGKYYVTQVVTGIVLIIK